LTFRRKQAAALERSVPFRLVRPRRRSPGDRLIDYFAFLKDLIADAEIPNCLRRSLSGG